MIEGSFPNTKFDLNKLKDDKSKDLEVWYFGLENKPGN